MLNSAADDKEVLSRHIMKSGKFLMTGSGLIQIVSALQQAKNKWNNWSANGKCLPHKSCQDKLSCQDKISHQSPQNYQQLFHGASNIMASFYLGFRCTLPFFLGVDLALSPPGEGFKSLDFFWKLLCLEAARGFFFLLAFNSPLASFLAAIAAERSCFETCCWLALLSGPFFFLGGGSVGVGADPFFTVCVVSSSLGASSRS